MLLESLTIPLSLINMLTVADWKRPDLYSKEKMEEPEKNHKILIIFFQVNHSTSFSTNMKIDSKYNAQISFISCTVCSQSSLLSKMFCYQKKKKKKKKNNRI